MGYGARTRAKMVGEKNRDAEEGTWLTSSSSTR